MLHLLLGSDSYTKANFVNQFANKLGTKIIPLNSENFQSDGLGASGGDLFGSLNIFTFTEPTPDSLTENTLTKLKESSDHYFFLTDSLDMRKKINKELLSDKNVQQKSFNIPEGPELHNWVKQYLANRSKTIEPKAFELLTHRLGLNLDLWRVASELDKLSLFSSEATITESDIAILVAENTEVEIYELVNALAQKDRRLLVSLLEKFFSDTTSSDEKSKTIQLAALISEQLRSLLLVKSAQAQRVPDKELVELTGWKPARVSIVKRTSQIFHEKLLIETLNKFTHLDMELKTSNTPPRVLLDLILAQIVSV